MSQLVGEGWVPSQFDAALAAAEQLLQDGREQAFLAFGPVIAAGVIAATEPIADG